MQDLVINKVHDFRAKTSIRQEDLAKAVGVTRQTIIAIEHGNYAPSIILALKIAKFFNTSVEKLFIIDYDQKNHSRN